MLESLRLRLARFIAPLRAGVAVGMQRSYAAARPSRLTADWYAPQTSAVAELDSSLRTLRARARTLVRDSGYARRAKEIVVNNVVGTGIGLQADVRNQRGRLLDAINGQIEDGWEEWSQARYCHTGGVLSFNDLERLVIGEVFESGEAFVRLHRYSFGGSRVPLALEIIEPERLADQMHPSVPPPSIVRLGIELDAFSRPIAYYVTDSHPAESRHIIGETDRVRRIDADDVLHIYLCTRWPQVRGVPWLHAAMGRLNDMNGYSEAEIVAARAAASYMGFIKTPSVESPLATQTEGTQRQLELQAGIVEQLAPGEDFVGWAPNRPNPNMDPFLRLMLREVAAGVGVSYESLSRDYSQSNYSSSRLALLDDRDVWRVLQQWLIRAFRRPLHRIWLQQAALAKTLPAVPADQYLLNTRKFEAAAFKPRGWSWVDPTKEVEAYREAVRCGFATTADVIAATANGQDLEDVMQARRRELDLMAELGLRFDTEAAREQVSAPEQEIDTETPETSDTD